jgi:hypothetical protein
VDFFLAVPSADWLNFQGEQAAPAGTIRGRSTTPRHRKQNGRGRGVRHCTPSPRCLLGRPKQRTNQPHREWKFLLLEQKRRLSIPLSLSGIWKGRAIQECACPPLTLPKTVKGKGTRCCTRTCINSPCSKSLLLLFLTYVDGEIIYAVVRCCHRRRRVSEMNL